MSQSTQVFTGDMIGVYQALAVKQALKLYRDTGVKVNTAYTPTRMLNTASRITGKIFKRGQFTQAIEALQEWVDDKRGT